MAFHVVFLECRRFISIHEDWIQNPVVGEDSKFFISPNTNTAPDFTLDTCFYVRPVDACYNAFVYRKFGEFQMIGPFYIYKFYIVYFFGRESITGGIVR